MLTNMQQVLAQKALNMKKGLDKVGELRYNIHKDGRGVLDPYILLNNSYGKDRSTQLLETLVKVQQFVNDFMSKYPHLPQPVLAGGFVRDLILGLPANDIDIFFPFGPTTSKSEIQDELEFLGLQLVGGNRELLTSRGEEYMSEPEIKKDRPLRSVVDIRVENIPYTIQLIGTTYEDTEKFPLDLIADFPYNLCMGYFDFKSSELVYSAKFMEGVKNREFVLYKETTKFVRTKYLLASKNISFSVKENYKKEKRNKLETNNFTEWKKWATMPINRV